MSTQTVTITVTNGGSPVADAEVQLIQRGFIVCSAMTSGSGQVVFPLVTNGSYTLEVRKPGVGPYRAALTVADTGIAQSFSAAVTVIAISAPTELGRCRVFGYVQTAFQGSRRAQVILTAVSMRTQNVGGTGTAVEDGILASPEESITVEVGLRTAGYWEADLVIGGTYRMEVIHTAIRTTFEVPNAISANILDLPEIPFPSTYPSLIPS
jgi:hypothetical protein